MLIEGVNFLKVYPGAKVENGYGSGLHKKDFFLQEM